MKFVLKKIEKKSQCRKKKSQTFCDVCNEKKTSRTTVPNYGTFWKSRLCFLVRYEGLYKFYEKGHSSVGSVVWRKKEKKSHCKSRAILFLQKRRLKMDSQREQPWNFCDNLNFVTNFFFFFFSRKIKPANVF